jgi:hypothetical protein
MHSPRCTPGNPPHVSISEVRSAVRGKALFTGVLLSRRRVCGPRGSFACLGAERRRELNAGCCRRFRHALATSALTSARAPVATVRAPFAIPLTSASIPSPTAPFPASACALLQARSVCRVMQPEPQGAGRLETRRRSPVFRKVVVRRGRIGLPRIFTHGRRENEGNT